MAMEMMKYLGKATLDFSKVNKLMEEGHRQAFSIIFRDVMTLVSSKDDESISIFVREKIDFSIPCEWRKQGKWNIYEFHSVGNGAFRELADDLYLSNLFEAEFVFSESNCRVLVCMDPVYFSIGPA